MLRLERKSFRKVIAGVLAGMYNEYTNMVYYHKYKALNEYSNVLPTASIMSILDGAVLYFSSSTVIDTQRASAFKSARRVDSRVAFSGFEYR